MTKTILKELYYSETNALAGIGPVYQFHKGKILYQKSLVSVYSLKEQEELLKNKSREEAIKFLLGEKIIKPKEEEWGLFLKTLDELNIWGWKENYFNPDVMDGDGFTLSVVTNKNKVRTEGANDYPPNYFDFIKAFKKLVKENIEA